jgi:Cof subfamily protein (haloacid dehalogenase superfamily)
MQVRAIATDLDGTLLRTDKTVSARTRAAIDAAADAGILIVIATGRPPRWIPPVIEQLGERGLVVCANGASVYDPARHELVHRVELEPEVAAALVDDIEAEFPEAILAVEQGFDWGLDPAVASTGYDLDSIAGEVTVAPIRSFLDRPVTKLIVRLPHESAPGVAARVQAVVGDRALVTHSTVETFLELSHPSVHKASAVERLLVESGVQAGEVIAFGDMPNDLELVRWAGHGVAVANAHPLLLEHADEITASNDDDGVALVIERLLPSL